VNWRRWTREIDDDDLHFEFVFLAQRGVRERFYMHIGIG
jgi:hypothetical protein